MLHLDSVDVFEAYTYMGIPSRNPHFRHRGNRSQVKSHSQTQGQSRPLQSSGHHLLRARCVSTPGKHIIQRPDHS